MSDPNNPRVEVMERRMAKIASLLRSAKPIACTCDFTEQGQHLSCPTYVIGEALELAERSTATSKIKETR